MDAVTLTVVGHPVPQGSMAPISSGRGRAYVRTPERLLVWRGKIAKAVVAARQAGEIPAEPLRGPVGVTLAFSIATPASAPERHGKPHGLPPDLDKLVRGVLDGLTQSRVLVDDAQVAGILARVAWVQDGRVDVRTHGTFGALGRYEHRAGVDITVERYDTWEREVNEEKW